MKQSKVAETEHQQSNHSQHQQTRTSPLSQTFVDNRKSAQQLRQLKAMMDNSPQAIAQRKLSDQLHNSPYMIAHAYAQSTDIHLAPGQEQHLQHEVWHVVQQAQERVRPTMQMAGQQINDDQGLEREADLMGDRASSFGVVQEKSKLDRSIELDPLGVQKDMYTTHYQHGTDQNTNAVIQRDAYWPTPALGNNIPGNPFAVADDPGGSRVHRVGGSRNHRLHRNSAAARTAAEQDLKLGGERNTFTAVGGAGAGAGTYTFYAFYKEEPYEPYYTKVLVNHNADPNATLTNTNGNVVGPVNHYHAGIIPGQVVTEATPNPWDINYNRVETAAEHYFDASNI